MNRFPFPLCAVVLFTTLVFMGCGGAGDNGSGDNGTWVKLIIADNTNTIDPSSKHILSCYEEGNDSDFRYALYSTERSVVFHDIVPGQYVCHASSPYTLGKNGVRVTVNEGDRTTIVFTYGYGSTVTVGNPTSGYYTVTLKEWSYRIQ